MERLPRSRGDSYALAALKNRRASIASEIVQLERQLRHCQETLVHVDATLKLLDPDSEPGRSPPSGLQRRSVVLKIGEGRMRAGGWPRFDHGLMSSSV